MGKASFSPGEPAHYILFLDTKVNEHGQAMAMISGFSLMIIPAAISSDIAVVGSLYEAATGEEIGAYEAQGVLEVFIWLPLLPVTPITLVTGPGKELYDDTYRDLLIQVARDLKGRPLPNPVPAGKIKIEEEPQRVRRSITVN